MDGRRTSKRTALAIGSLGFLVLLLAAPASYAQPVAPVTGEFTVVFQGVDPITGELIFEGFKTGELPGDLSIRASLSRQTGTVLHILARWTLLTPWGETMNGENTATLNTVSLHFRELGVIVAATGGLAELIGDFIVIHGQFSDLSFMPGVMQVDGTATIVPSQAPFEPRRFQHGHAR